MKMRYRRSAKARAALLRWRGVLRPNQDYYFWSEFVPRPLFAFRFGGRRFMSVEERVYGRAFRV